MGSTLSVEHKEAIPHLQLIIDVISNIIIIILLSSSSSTIEITKTATQQIAWKTPLLSAPHTNSIDNGDRK